MNKVLHYTNCDGTPDMFCINSLNQFQVVKYGEFDIAILKFQVLYIRKVVHYITIYDVNQTGMLLSTHIIKRLRERHLTFGS